MLNGILWTAAIISILIFGFCAVLSTNRNKQVQPIVTSSLESRSGALIVRTIFGAGFDGTILDTSALEKEGVMILSIMFAEEAKSETDKFLQTFPLVYDKAKVYQDEKGQWRWEESV